MELLAQQQGLWVHWIWPILQFIIGLGVVVFVHELGHFLVAKFVNIKVERFAIGFGPRLVGFKKGETDYCICAVPLGGYIKMLGQEDFAPLKDEKPDPRSYAAKSVGQRFAVIAAGVIMNAIFAVLAFSVVGMVGKEFPAPVVGGVMPESPAEKAEIKWRTGLPVRGDGNDANASDRKTTIGMEPLDRIASLNGEQLRRLDILSMKGMLSGASETHLLEIERTVDGQTHVGTTELGVKKLPVPNFNTRAHGFGIFPASEPNVVAAPKDSPIKPGDRILSVAGRPVGSVHEIKQIVEPMRAESVTITVRRDGKEQSFQAPLKLATDPEEVLFLKDDTRLDAMPVEVTGSGEDKALLVRTRAGELQTVDFDKVLQSPELLDVLGMSPMLAIQEVMPDSPAKKAGLQKGDVIYTYGGKGHITFDKLRETNTDNVGVKTKISVLRNGETFKTEITPTESDGQSIIGIVLGIADRPVVAGVRPGSPAAAKGIVAGDEILRIGDANVPAWRDVLARLDAAWEANEPVAVTYDHDGDLDRLGEPNMITFESIRGDYDPNDYIALLGVQFEPMQVMIRESNPIKAIGWGFGETYRQIIGGYFTIKGLITRDVSHKAVAGPVGIGAVAVQFARKGPVDFLYFIALISAILAVMNFLPLPVLDGGHAVFLIIEGIRGKPLPVKVMNWIQGIGLAALALLFILLTWVDIGRLLS